MPAERKTQQENEHMDGISLHDQKLERRGMTKKYYTNIMNWLRGSYERQRNILLHADAGKLHLPVGAEALPLGVVVEVGVANGKLLIAEFSNRKIVRLFCGRTGIVKEWSCHKPMIRSSGRMVALSYDLLSLMTSDSVLPFPEEGKVVIHIITNDGVRSTSVDWEGHEMETSPLTPLIEEGLTIAEEMKPRCFGD